MRGCLLLVFVFVWVTSLVCLATICEWLGSLHAYGEHSHAQVALAIALCLLSASWLAAEMCELARRVLCPDVVFQAVPTENHPEPSTIGNVQEQLSAEEAGDAATAEEWPKKSAVNGRPPSTETLLGSALVPLRACGELTVIVAVMYLCDRTDVLGKGPKVQSGSYFWGLWAAIMVVGLLSTKKLEKARPLQRDQTDEWKGWMQLMFVMYHYFKEEEVYNAIRVYIAAYVFMTGYGNFFLYAKGKSYTARRNLQMMFRLNFLGVIVCVALNNEYMLYYICAMHSLFTIIPILMLYFWRSVNTAKKWVYAKMAITFVITVVIYDGPAFIFKALFGTLPGIRFLFAFHDPLHPEFKDEMHEFHFRSGLDRFIWILGMLCAFHFPNFEAFLEWVANKQPLHRTVLTAGLLATCFAASATWVYFVFSKGKYDYNAVHPYTSWLPILVYILVRNVNAPLRSRYMSFFAYLGKYTLETYILQFHVWMKTTGINGSPKSLLILIPGHFWLNFAVLSAAYLFLSVRLCEVTVTLRDALIPEDNFSIGARCACSAFFFCACWGISPFLHGDDSVLRAFHR